MKTIKELADELGVSKTAVMKKIDNLGLREKLAKNGNRLAIREPEEKLIIEAFSKKESTTANQKPPTKSTTANQKVGDSEELISSLLEQLKAKDLQLAKKDEQIAKLMETVADGTKAVQGAQALHHETAQALALESAEQKLSRWQRLRRAWRG
jgi:transcriptional antiterminator